MLSELAREKMWARIYLIPALQAEEDRDQVRRYLADKAREKELLGTETKVYNSDRYSVIPAVIRRTWLTVWQICASDICCDPGERAEVGGGTGRGKKWNRFCTYTACQGETQLETCPPMCATIETTHIFFRLETVLHIGQGAPVSLADN